MINGGKGRQHMWMDGGIQERSEKCKKKINGYVEIKKYSNRNKKCLWWTHLKERMSHCWGGNLWIKDRSIEIIQTQYKAKRVEKERTPNSCETMSNSLTYV